MAISLLEEIPARTIGYPLSPPYNIALHLIIPSSVGLVLYLVLISADIGLVAQHLREGNPRWATATLILMYTPAACCFIFTISLPSLWPTKKPFSRENFRFLLIQAFNFLLFPVAVIMRYCVLVFWSLEALFANLHCNYERQEEALRTVMHPSPLELYFFLQAYLHAAPQIMLQMYIVLQEVGSKETVNLQLLCIVSMLMRMSSTTAKYQRFERRKVLGDCYPWSLKQIEKITSHYNNDNVPQTYPTQKSTLTSQTSQEEEKAESISSDDVFERPVSPPRDETDRGLLEVHQRIESFGNRVRFADKIANISETESEGEHFLRPVVRPKIQSDPESIINEPEIVKEETIELRIKTGDARRDYNIEDMSKYTTPPDTPAPRPSSLAIFRDKIMSNAEFLIDKIPRRTYKNHDDVDLPVRIRRTAIKGLEPEDGIARFVCIVSWFLFVTVRLLALTIFIHFHPYEGLYIVVFHYITATGILMWNSWRERIYRRVFYLFLGYVYIFCLLEFKMKFRKVRIWYGLFFIVVGIENFLMTAVWFFTDSYNKWWYSYLAIIISFGSFMSFMCFLVYNLMLKPKTKVVYPLISRDCVFPVTIS